MTTTHRDATINRLAKKPGLRAKIDAKCCAPECDKPAVTKGYCNVHYIRLTRYGRLHSIRRQKGAGTVKGNGYVAIGTNGSLQYEHILIAEKALGKSLPYGSDVHHVDGNRSNNNPLNLVICQNREYHMMLHRRTNALESCGHASWQKCAYCGMYDDPVYLKLYNGKAPRHNECAVRYNREWRNKNA